MTEQLITFETAKMAKEKGCNLFKLDLGLNQFLNNKGITQSLLQKWLRDTRNIGVFVTKPPSYLVEYEAQIVKLPVGHSLVNVWQDSSEIKGSSYEEALENGLQEALKLIK